MHVFFFARRKFIYIRITEDYGVFQFIWLNPFFLIFLNTQVTNRLISSLDVIVFWAVENVKNNNYK